MTELYDAETGKGVGAGDESLSTEDYDNGLIAFYNENENQIQLLFNSESPEYIVKELSTSDMEKATSIIKSKVTKPKKEGPSGEVGGESDKYSVWRELHNSNKISQGESKNLLSEVSTQTDNICVGEFKYAAKIFNGIRQLSKSLSVAVFDTRKYEEWNRKDLDVRIFVDPEYDGQPKRIEEGYTASDYAADSESTTGSTTGETSVWQDASSAEVSGSSSANESEKKAESTSDRSDRNSGSRTETAREEDTTPADSRANTAGAASSSSRSESGADTRTDSETHTAGTGSTTGPHTSEGHESTATGGTEAERDADTPRGETSSPAGIDPHTAVRIFSGTVGNEHYNSFNRDVTRSRPEPSEYDKFNARDDYDNQLRVYYDPENYRARLYFTGIRNNSEHFVATFSRDRPYDGDFLEHCKETLEATLDHIGWSLDKSAGPVMMVYRNLTQVSFDESPFEEGELQQLLDGETIDLVVPDQGTAIQLFDFLRERTDDDTSMAICGGGRTGALDDVDVVIQFRTGTDGIEPISGTETEARLDGYRLSASLDCAQRNAAAAVMKAQGREPQDDSDKDAREEVLDDSGLERETALRVVDAVNEAVKSSGEAGKGEKAENSFSSEKYVSLHGNNVSKGTDRLRDSLGWLTVEREDGSERRLRNAVGVVTFTLVTLVLSGIAFFTGTIGQVVAVFSGPITFGLGSPIPYLNIPTIIYLPRRRALFDLRGIMLVALTALPVVLTLATLAHPFSWITTAVGNTTELLSNRETSKLRGYAGDLADDLAEVKRIHEKYAVGPDEETGASLEESTRPRPTDDLQIERAFPEYVEKEVFEPVLGPRFELSDTSPQKRRRKSMAIGVGLGLLAVAVFAVPTALATVFGLKLQVARALANLAVVLWIGLFLLLLLVARVSGVEHETPRDALTLRSLRSAVTGGTVWGGETPTSDRSSDDGTDESDDSSAGDSTDASDDSPRR